MGHGITGVDQIIMVLQAPTLLSRKIFDSSRGVKWKSKLPGASKAHTHCHWRSYFHPINLDFEEWGAKGEGQLLAMCYSASDGKLIWSRNAGSGYRPGKSDGFDYMLHDRSNYASPSPAVGNDLVFFFFGNGDLVAYNFQGNERWRRNLQQDYGDFCFQWTFPLRQPFSMINFTYLYLQRDEPVHGRGKQGTKSFLLCMDPVNGKTLWKHTPFRC